MQKIININGQRFALPEGMTAKEVQALAGFLFSLHPVESDYDYDRKEYLHSVSERGAQVQLESVTLMDRAAAQAQSRTSYDRYLAAKEKAAA